MVSAPPSPPEILAGEDGTPPNAPIAPISPIGPNVPPVFPTVPCAPQHSPLSSVPPNVPHCPLSVPPTSLMFPQCPQFTPVPLQCPTHPPAAARRWQQSPPRPRPRPVPQRTPPAPPGTAPVPAAPRTPALPAGKHPPPLPTPSGVEGRPPPWRMGWVALQGEGGVCGQREQWDRGSLGWGGRWGGGQWSVGR